MVVFAFRGQPTSVGSSTLSTTPEWRSWWPRSSATSLRMPLTTAGVPPIAVCGPCQRMTSPSWARRMCPACSSMLDTEARGGPSGSGVGGFSPTSSRKALACQSRPLLLTSMPKPSHQHACGSPSGCTSPFDICQYRKKLLFCFRLFVCLCLIYCRISDFYGNRMSGESGLVFKLYFFTSFFFIVCWIQSRK
eukprot:Rmarinus@m.4879